MQVKLTAELKRLLERRGFNLAWQPGSDALPLQTRFEPPCSLKWAVAYHSLSLGAFSYAVSGFLFAARVGRYVSIAENVQIGRGDHPTDWLGTSPFLYSAAREVFVTGTEFEGGEAFANHRPAFEVLSRSPSKVEPVVIGHDVWIGHGAHIRPGVQIGNGAIIGAEAVVTRDVPAYATVAGNPAEIRKMRFPSELIDRLEASEWWQYAPWDLKGVPVDRVGVALDEIDRRRAAGLLHPYRPKTIDLKSLL